MLAIGNFDGVHRGHQALIEAAVETARALGAPAGALMFEPHPREFFHPEEPHFRLTPLKEKLEIFEALGLDLAIVLAFDAALAGLAADDFIARVLVEGLGVAPHRHRPRLLLRQGPQRHAGDDAGCRRASSASGSRSSRPSPRMARCSPRAPSGCGWRRAT